MSNALAQDLSALLGAQKVFSDARVRQTFSRDAYHFSPVLSQALEGKVADLVVVPSSKDELYHLIDYAVRQGVPVTMRGAGTGNYGQSVPLHGGIVVLTRALNKRLDIDPERQQARAETAVVIGKLEQAANKHRLEVRCYPSTWMNATIGGFVSGGFGGVGSVRHGTLWDGYLAEIELLSATSPPQWRRVVEPTEMLGFIHAYGVSGIITELSVNLVPAVPWREATFAFAAMESALRFGHAVATAGQLDTRLITVLEPGITPFLIPLVQNQVVEHDKAAVLLELKDGQLPLLEDLARPLGGTLTWSRDAQGYHASAFNLSDFSWNHTTHWARKTSEQITYLQTMHHSDFETSLAHLETLKAAYGDHMLMHQEFFLLGGNLTMAGLPLIHYRGAQQLQEIAAHCEALGIQIADPHTYFLDADSRWNGQPVLDAAARWNPHRLLNPGKLRQALL